MLEKEKKLNKQLLSSLNLKLVQQYLNNILGKNILHNRLRNNTEIDIELPAYIIYSLMRLIKSDTTVGNDSILVDITVIDYPEHKNRFIVSYNMLILSNIRVCVKSKLTELTALLSITGLWQNAS
jgi:NADH:ubiquinone oxidoreductase subunit C